MSRRSSTVSVRLWLVAALFGVSGLLLAGAAPDGATATGQISFQGNATAYAAAPSTDTVVPAHLRHGSHALPRTSASATPARAAGLVAPDFADEQAPRENPATLASAPRIPGLSRAPPAA